MATAVMLEPRVTKLESAMAAAFSAIAEASTMAKEASRAAASASRVAEQTSREMAEFKNEMAEFKNEMRAFKEESRIDREQSRKELREMNRQWGALANKMGTMAEDLVAPSIPRILRTVLGCPGDRIEEMAVRVRRRSQLDRTRSREFDVITACGDWFLINETKSTLAPEDVSDFVEVLSSVREFFPEQAHRQIVGVIASLYVDESLARHAERNGLIVLSFGDDGMDLRNTEGFFPRLF
ncbi:MAG: hypothetical protein DWI57_06200 [Chloroflexi bacterium]|nr:MAG: hypothetical protein DWI57_06200 [Chloroflexota bacterium]